MCEFVIELLSVFLSCIILKLYYSIFFEKKKRKFSRELFWLIYVVWQFMISKENILPAYINVLISITCVILICVTSYQGNIWQKIVFSVLINAIWMLIELLIGYIFLLSGLKIYYSTSQYLGSILSKAVTLLLIILLKMFFKNENIINLSKKSNIVLLLIPVGSMFVVYNIFVLSLYVENRGHLKESLTSSFLVLLINIIMFTLYVRLSKEKEIQRRNTVYEKQLELCKQHMAEKEAIMMEFRNARHDMKQHYIVLMDLINKNKNEQAQKYLSELIEKSIINKVGICHTDNIVVDSLVNAKYAMALKQKIKFKIDIHIPIQLPFENADISVLLGNILDNAIEASLLIPVEMRKIEFYMKSETNILIITAINAFSGKINKNKNGQIVTMKEIPENHGIGLESIRKVANKYKGSVVIETEEQIFKIKVILCAYM